MWTYNTPPCPVCGGELHVEWRLEMNPLNMQGVAGMQMKVTATRHPWVVCEKCGAEAKGMVEEK
jgi:transposase